MIQDMEKCVYRRETIIIRFVLDIESWGLVESNFLTSEDAQTKVSNPENTRGALRRKLVDTQRSIQQASADIAQYVY